MFCTNDYIIYETTGICKIYDIRNMKFGNNPERLYYVIRPIYDEKCTIYAPVDNDELNIRPMMNLDEVQILIKELPDQNTIWIDDVNLRKEKYTEIVKNGDRKELIKLIKTLYLKKKEQKQIGKKLLANDERLLTEAERILHEELAVILGIKIEEVIPFIKSELEKATA